MISNAGSYSNLLENQNFSLFESFNRVYTQNSYGTDNHFRPLICRPHRLWHRLMLCRLTRKISFRYAALAIFIVVIIVLSWLFSSSRHTIVSLMRKPPPVSVFHCSNTASFIPHQHTPPENVSSFTAKLREEPKILLFAETQHSKLGKAIAELLVANRIKYKMEVIGKSLPILTNLSRGKYGVIIFENYERYLSMDQWNRELLDKYLLAYRVGIIGFMPQHDESTIAAKIHNFPLYVTTNLPLNNITLNGENPVLRLTRAGETAIESSHHHNWTVFTPDHPTFSPIEWAMSPQIKGEKQIVVILMYPATRCCGSVWLNGKERKEEANVSNIFNFTMNEHPVLLIAQGSFNIFSEQHRDEGRFDNIKRILFGGGLQFWLHHMLLLDSLSYLSLGRLLMSLDRYILVDIDDIFVGPSGLRMTPDDVEALLAAQDRLQTQIVDFKFNLGFSGKYFLKGSSYENLGDDLLLKSVDKFWWFGHMWGHTQPHKVETVEQLVMVMEKNKQFAVEKGIPTDSGYSVSPHHSGIYPVHEPLYEAWKKVWNIRVTSSEEYPHLRPARLRRGFIHRNIMVLPRQTCGLFTHTNFLEKYPGGRDILDKSIQGGELFQTVINNPISIFMTHQNNYANDRLALYTFETLTKFIKCWTNIKMLSAPPLQLGEKYFHLYPSEADPVWGNPCLDQRHINIWSANKSCSQLPQFLVIGPQKTGTTALYTFLAMHPEILSNNPSPETFEEIQFFNGKNYYKGIDWYMKFFPVAQNGSNKYLFEKSATYFEGEVVPKRVKALLPHVKLVIIIIPPEKRAYSWYHHMRAHNDATSLTYSFLQVINATSKAPRTLRDLRNKCLTPGMYAKNIERWLDYFPASKLSIIDGEELRNEPVVVMNDLQKFLGIDPFFNYTEHLRFDKRKGFFCQIIEEDKTKCLGRGKGRQYPLMDTFEEKLLKEFYREHNTALEKLLVRLNIRVPPWLYQELSG